jgi:hypothetical protein
MKNTGWKMVGSEENTRIVEFRVEDPHDKLTPYEEAKAAALQSLRDHVAPYLARIEEIEQNLFAETGALPPLKAWRYDYGHKAIVTAKTKRRAIELAETTRHSFDSNWHECEGDWWYHLAHEESVWIEEQDDKKRGTGVYYKPLTREEAEQILEQHISRYRTMGIGELLSQVGQNSTVADISSQGTPYKVTTEVERGRYAEDLIFVRVQVDDFLGWKCPDFSLHERDLSKLTPIGAVNWVKEGF